jgi:hypothetical protein
MPRPARTEYRAIIYRLEGFAMFRRLDTRYARASAVLALAAGLFAARSMDAQGHANGPTQYAPILKVFYACYVPNTGTTYRIKEANLPQACTSLTHVEFHWTDGVASPLQKGDSAAGDLAGTYPNPTVAGLRGRKVAAIAPANGQALVWDSVNAKWTPQTLGSGGGVKDHGLLTGLGDDDHKQYLLMDGVRNTTNGVAVTGTFGVGTIPVTGQGIRMMWYPGKAAFRAGFVYGTEWDDAQIGQSSTAFGLGNIASGGASLAGGSFSTASSSATLAYGDHANASYYNAVALGERVTASGRSSFAAGSYSNATYQTSIALGDNVTSSGGASFASGAYSKASGYVATAMGSHTVASGIHATALGYLTNATGNVSTAMGNQSVASGVEATAIGKIANATGPNTVAIGTSVLANGQYSMAFGNYASTSGQYGAFVYGDASTTNWLLANKAFEFAARASGGFRFRTSSDLSTGCNLPSGSGVWQCTSSRFSKDDFRDLDGESVLSRLAAIPVQSWRYKNESGDVRHVGPTAQDFYSAFRLGTDDASIGLLDISGVSIKGVQALEKRTSELKAENAALRAELQSLRKDLADRLARLELQLPR